MGKAIRTNQNFQEPPAIRDGAKWFCVMTNPGCQVRAEKELYSLGYRAFSPKIRKWASHARVRRAVEKPLLGRYLFVEVDNRDDGQSFGAVRNVNGVEMILSGVLPDRTWGPLPFPSHWVEGFLSRYMAGEWDFVRQEPVHYLDENGEKQTRQNDRTPVGARIRIIEGEFDDMLATVTSRKSGKLHCKLLDTNIYTQLREYGVRAA